MPKDQPPATGLMRRLGETARPQVRLRVDGQPVDALEGDTVLSALLLAGIRLRITEFEARPRAGFCLMGACHDCMVWTSDGERLRACSTEVRDGLDLITREIDAECFVKLSS